MFFFIAGIQPKTVELEGPQGICSSCGLYQARLKRVDHYLSLFFIPILRVKKGDPFRQCLSCGAIFGGSGEAAWPNPSTRLENRCSRCGGLLQSAFRFCPNCGKEIV